MRVCERLECVDFPCPGVNHKAYIVPGIDVDPDSISVILISESAPTDPSDYYYTRGNPLYQQTTVQAFNDAGLKVSSVQDILELGVYLTTAVKCGKLDYVIRADPIKKCSSLLEIELSLFPHAEAYLLMGDVAIKAMNYIARANGEKRVIPAGSTYKIRNGTFLYQGKRVFPSYLQAGPSFFIEKSKRRMIAEDIAQALHIVTTAK